MTKKQFELDKRYMRMAQIWAGNSYCVKRQVGALLVKDKMIISDGYNGTPSGFENVCEVTKLVESPSEDGVYKPHLTSKPEVLHAEANAITKVAKSNNSSLGSTLYVTCAPCIDCAKLIIQSGIVRVVYLEAFKNDDGLKLLEKAKVKVNQIKPEWDYPEFDIPGYESVFDFFDHSSDNHCNIKTTRDDWSVAVYYINSFLDYLKAGELMWVEFREGDKKIAEKSYL